jgi:hypothetical protein
MKRTVMRKLEDYIRMLQPTEDDKAILIYGSKYRLWLLGNYIGTALWVCDDSLGDSFQNQVVVNGQLLKFVYVADEFELVIDKRKQKATN